MLWVEYYQSMTIGAPAEAIAIGCVSKTYESYDGQTPQPMDRAMRSVIRMSCAMRITWIENALHNT